MALNTLNLNLYHEPLVNAIGINHACELTSNLQWWSSITHISLGCSFLYLTTGYVIVLLDMKLKLYTNNANCITKFISGVQIN